MCKENHPKANLPNAKFKARLWRNISISNASKNKRFTQYFPAANNSNAAKFFQLHALGKARLWRNISISNASKNERFAQYFPAANNSNAANSNDTTATARAEIDVTVINNDASNGVCLQSVIATHYSCCALLLAIFFFSYGIICCLCLGERYCDCCGTIHRD